MRPPSEATFGPVDTRRSMMSESQRKTSRPWEPQRSRQDAQSPDAKLPEGDVVFFLLDLGPQLDVRRFDAPSEDDTRGAPPFAPAMLVCLWLYAYGGGVFLSPTMAQACERHVALGALVGTARPACRTISDLRPLHVEALREVFGQVRRVAGGWRARRGWSSWAMWRPPGRQCRGTPRGGPATSGSAGESRRGGRAPAA